MLWNNQCQPIPGPISMLKQTHNYLIKTHKLVKHIYTPKWSYIKPIMTFKLKLVACKTYVYIIYTIFIFQGKTKGPNVYLKTLFAYMFKVKYFIWKKNCTPTTEIILLLYYICCEVDICTYTIGSFGQTVKNYECFVNLIDLLLPKNSESWGHYTVNASHVYHM